MKKTDSQLTEYEKFCRMMAQQQEDEMDETIMDDALSPTGCFQRKELKVYQPDGGFVRGH